MRSRGWKWSQATMWSVERGERPLRLTEAKDLVAILGCQLMDLFSEATVLDTEATIKDLIRGVEREYREATLGLIGLSADQDLLRVTIQQSAIADDPRFQGVLGLAGSVLKLTPERAFRKAQLASEPRHLLTDFDDLEIELDNNVVDGF